MRDILFMGAVIASVTHEMQNVMAIIKESGALADDILTLNGRPSMRYGDKLETALAGIQQQIERGRALMLMLNGFAHAAEEHPESGDLARFARQICIPAQRLARLKNCSLTPALPAPGSTPLVVRGNALTLMESVYAGVAAVLAGCAEHDALHVVVAPAREGEAEPLALVRAETSRAVPDLAAVAPVMAELGGACRAGEGFAELRYSPVSPREGARP